MEIKNKSALKLAAVVIPIYREPNELETVSLIQAKRMLSQYDIVYIIPQSLDITTFNQYIAAAKLERFADKYFDSISSYNSLMLSVDFYNCFTEYTYILIHQPDAFVFSDRLGEFCHMGYDYIGAPWLHGMFIYKSLDSCIRYVGNGGLSLRRVQACIDLLKKKQGELAEYAMNEDLFFSGCGSEEFKIAPVSIALEFAFEKQVKDCFERNHNHLPFGCHAWERYDIGFWKPHIEKYGYQLPDLKGGREDIDNRDNYQRMEKLCDFFKDVINIKDLSQKISNKQFAIFGTGFCGMNVLKMLLNMNGVVNRFYDNKPMPNDSLFFGYPVYSPEYIISESGMTVIASFQYSGEIVCQLTDMGLVRRKNFVTIFDLVNF